MNVEFTRVRAVEPRDRDAMFALMEDHFETMVRDRFEEDLNGKDWALLVKEGGRVIGFTTVQLLDRPDAPCQPVAIYSGDTLVDSKYRTGATFVKGWFAAMRFLQKQYAGRPLYWLLICSSFRTYRFLPVYWRRFHPSHGNGAPDMWRKLMNELAHAQFGEGYDPVSGIVRLPYPQVLHAHFREIPGGRIANTDIAFFARRNPGHVYGDELVCLTRIHEENLTAIGRKYWHSNHLKFRIVSHEPVQQNS